MNKVQFLIVGVIAVLSLAIMVTGIGLVIAVRGYGAELLHYRYYIIENDLDYPVRIGNSPCSYASSFHPCHSFVDPGGTFAMKGWSQWARRQAIAVIDSNQNTEIRCFEYILYGNPVETLVPSWWAFWEIKRVTVSSKLSQHPVVALDEAGRPNCW